ncbi:MAG: nucleotide exchange factor GrpE [Myxococcota bacterium]|nr:nucleotide exchange factor GrpE [bacterium]MDP6075473.1 nucleotide exchange factor GrpE [Myxococcota bacterium]MDP6244247.1 nucleotide exchange factor GrpE [Myxococcota bacterium]MDP7075921.1 nucleotide exchange factor GrpE [Myxococcota bacterium]MDP7300217.1 nucleotide exchange factor GrpE [Myxococcota bacterium]
MSPRKRKIEVKAEESEGGESAAEEASEGSLAPSPELEEALREATAAVEGSAAEAGNGEASPAGDPAGEALPHPEDLVREFEETRDRLLRLQADFENFKRRTLKERTDAHQYGHENLVKDLLPTVDNLDRAIDHARKSGGGDLESLLQGVELVQRELLAALTKHGVVRIEALEQSFDPAFHEAMAQVPHESAPTNTVIEELQKGYRLRDRLIRPSRVVVARGPEDALNGQEKTETEGDAG